MNEHVAEPFRSILNATAEAVAPARVEPTPGPWEYIASTEHHGAYVMGPWGGDICDCYAMSDPTAPSVRNGGTSRPIPMQGERMDANAALIAAAPDMHAALSDPDWAVLLDAIERFSAGTHSPLVALGIIGLTALRLDHKRTTALAKAEGRP